MKKFGITAYVASALLAAGTVLTGAATPATAAANGGYVSLGDSYSSGVGAGNYIASSGSCNRSTNAYPYLWNAAHPSSSFNFNACSGATTDSVLGGQLSSLSSSTAFVTLTAGGNDAGFSDVMRTCILSIRSVCHDRVMAADRFIESTLPAKMDRLYSAIKAKAPNAKVVVLNYPMPYDLGSNTCAGLTNDSRYDLDEATKGMNRLISATARKYGFSVGDADYAFSYHRICNGDPWLHSLNVSDTGVSYHPTPDGQRLGYLQALNAVR
ncbi:SGNH/GDSL hydrolase family protein [Streptomyces sp. NPDC096324]|uniref:SGNH/GDSL hydrolase family protein n=1 Tax=Streptomyces sp. NPDC096324 TaxID=3366085 RepID=UPI0038273A96